MNSNIIALDISKKKIQHAGKSNRFIATKPRNLYCAFFCLNAEKLLT